MKFALIFALVFASLAFAQEEDYAVQDTFVEDEEEQQQEQPIEEEEPMEQRIIRPRRPQPVKERSDKSKKSYTLEYTVIVALIGYFVYFFVGKSINSKVVTK